MSYIISTLIYFCTYAVPIVGVIAALWPILSA